MVKKLTIILFFTLLFLFSFWLMWHTFSYDSKNSQILIASKLWSDFAANLPLIRSFSWGDNLPPEYPIFPGEPIKYHFLFYLLVGLLEKAGLRLDFALNIPSALSFFCLLVMIYLLSKLLFKSTSVAVLSVLFFLFNGTFSFLEFFKTHPLSFSFINQIYQLKDYPSFMPYGRGEVTAFWNLNIYINQRHLALAFFLILLVVYFLLRSYQENRPLSNKVIFMLGLILGLFPILHKPVFLMSGLVLACFFLFFPFLRRTLIKIGLLSFLIALPQFILTKPTTGDFSFYSGFLVHNQPLINFLRHWLLNLGLNIILIPLGFLLAPAPAKKVLLVFFSLFIVGNLFKFSPEIAANHKFFNLFIIIGNMASAFSLYLIWQKSNLGKIVALILSFFLILSGIIDFFPIKNDFRYTIDDAPKNQDVLWIKKNTPPKSVFLNTSYFYHPASLAGRKIFYGWPYFTWSAGYPIDTRRSSLIEIFQVKDPHGLCRLLNENKIDYVALGKESNLEEVSDINRTFWQNNFVPAYQNSETGLAIYQTAVICLPSP